MKRSGSGIVLHLAGAALLLASIATWAMTGREGYTRWPDAKLESADAPPAQGEDDLLSAIGFDTQEGARDAPPGIESRFALGLVPGGADPWRLPSVALAGAAAAALSLTAFVLSRRRSNRTSSVAPNHTPQGAH